MLHRLSLLLLLLCSAIVAPDILVVYDMKAWDIQRGPIVNGDGFMKVYCDNRPFGTTEVKENTRNPVWGESFMYRYASPGNVLKLKVYDKDIGNDTHLGTCRTTIKTGSYKITCNLFTGSMVKFRYIQHRIGGAAGQ